MLYGHGASKQAGDAQAQYNVGNTFEASVQLNFLSRLKKCNFTLL